MKRRKTLPRILLGILGVLLACLVVGIVSWITILKPAMDKTMENVMRSRYSPCVVVFEDLDADGRHDASEPSLNQLPGAEIIVDDPGGQNSGRFALSDCYLRPGSGQPQIIHLTVLLPPGYTPTTSLQQDVKVYAMFPYPAAYIGVQRSATP